jgi:hypothetical protein
MLNASMVGFQVKSARKGADADWGSCIASYSSGPKYTVMRCFFEGIFASGVERPRRE